MCPCCISCTKKAENELPEDELWQLYLAAYEQYQSVIVNGEKAYSRYVNDFVSYHLPAMGMTETDTRLHVMHVCSLKELLDERRDLVEAFFTKESFDEENFHQMLHLFETGKSLEPQKVILAHLSDKMILLITQFVNGVNLFMNDVTETDIKNLFECNSTVPLQASNNKNLAIFFNVLRYYGFLPFPWQMIMEEYKLVSSSASNKPLRASQLRCGLYQAKKSLLFGSENGFESVCEEFIKKLKECL